MQSKLPNTRGRIKCLYAMVPQKLLAGLVPAAVKQIQLCGIFYWTLNRDCGLGYLEIHAPKRCVFEVCRWWCAGDAQCVYVCYSWGDTQTHTNTYDSAARAHTNLHTHTHTHTLFLNLFLFYRWIILCANCWLFWRSAAHCWDHRGTRHPRGAFCFLRTAFLFDFAHCCDHRGAPHPPWGGGGGGGGFIRIQWY